MLVYGVVVQHVRLAREHPEGCVLQPRTALGEAAACLLSLILDRAERGGVAAINELLARRDALQARLAAMLRYLE